MRKYNEITFFANKYRIEKLIAFNNLVVSWMESVDHDYLEPIENEISRGFRTTVAQSIPEILKILDSSGVPYTIRHTPPRSIGGYIQNIDLISNIFNLYQHQIDVQLVLDSLNQAIGVYELDQKNSLIRTLNPFFWIGVLIKYIIAIPFKLLVNSGIISTNSEETNWVIRMIKSIGALLAWIILILGGIISISKELGLLDSLRQYFGI